MISFIVPAHNEQACLGATLQAIHGAARSTGHPYEIIVVNDASTDATAGEAREHGASVVDVKHRQIAATRNSGARAARGDRFIFVDADTIANPRAVAAAMEAMDRGAVGGGAPVSVDDLTPLYIRLLAFLSVLCTKIAGFTGGAFMFCTREAFHATGGFNEHLYWGEEGSFALALKREGRFYVLSNRVLTSGRRFRKTAPHQLLAGALRMLFSPVKMMTQRAAVEKIWYDSNRADDNKPVSSLFLRISNGIALLVIIDLLTGMLWDFVPWTWTPLSTPWGKLRFLNAAFLCHVGLFLWPVAMVLFVNLLRQKRCTGLLHSGALIGFCIWQGTGAARGVVHIWTMVGRWLIPS